MRNANPPKREKKKPKTAPPTLEELNFPNHNKISRPKKNNLQAIKRIKQGELLWNRKKVARKAEKQAAIRYASERKFFLHKDVRNQLLADMPSWSYSTELKAFTPNTMNKTALLDELSTAFAKLPDAPVDILLTGVTNKECLELRAKLPKGSRIKTHQKIELPGRQSPLVKWRI